MKSKYEMLASHGVFSYRPNGTLQLIEHSNAFTLIVLKLMDGIFRVCMNKYSTNKIMDMTELAVAAWLSKE
jgi:hypothetical protein